MENPKIWLFIGMGVVFFGAMLAYFLIMIFLPEWVGITGKTALEAQKSHRGDQVDEPSHEKGE